MFGNVTLGRIAGIGIAVHWTFWILFAVWTLSGVVSGGLSGGVGAAVTLAALFTCVVLHELGHSLTARAFGIGTRQITLTPLGGIAWLEGMPKHPSKELAIALAGPAVNVVLAGGLIAMAGGAALLGGPEVLSRLGAGDWLTWLIGMNLILAGFNLLPIFPTDGGRVLRAILGFATDYRTATWWAVRIGQTLAVGLGLLALVSGQFMLALVAGFLFLMAGQEIRRTEWEAQAESDPTLPPWQYQGPFAPRSSGGYARAPRGAAYRDREPVPGWSPDPTGSFAPRPAGWEPPTSRTDDPASGGSSPGATAHGPASREVIDLIPDGPGRFIIPAKSSTAASSTTKSSSAEPSSGVRLVWTSGGWRAVPSN